MNYIKELDDQSTKKPGIWRNIRRVDREEEENKFVHLFS
jgi:hypothetical protein